MRQIVDIGDLQASFDCDLALFAWTAWSGPCHLSRRVWLDAIRDIARCGDYGHIDFASVDLTEQDGDLWSHLQTLLADQRAIDSHTFMYAGAGSVAWIYDGNVVDWALNAATDGVEALAARTIELLGSVRSNDE